MKKTLINIVLIITVFATTAQNSKLQFKHLDINNGLSSNQVKAIYNDNSGFLWIGTVNGLNRFDGYKTKVFQKIKNDSTSLPDNTINSIHEDYLGNLWINTNSGITFYDPITEKFNSDHPIFHKNIEIPKTGFIDLITDSSKNFWIIHRQNGIYKYDYKNDSILHAHLSINSDLENINDVSIDKEGNFWLINSLMEIEVFDPVNFKIIKRYKGILKKIKFSANDYNIFIDNENEVWIFLVNDENGLYKFNPENNEVKHYSSKSLKYKISHDVISCLATDRFGNVLIATDHGGLNVVDKKTGSIAIYENDIGDKNSLSQNSITSLIRDNTDIIWIGTYKKGINYYHPDLFKFSTYTQNPTRKNWLSNEDVNTFAEDKKGNLWIGSNGGGLFYFDRHKNTFKTFKHDPNDPTSLSSDVIVDLCLDNEGGLWIGTYIGGLNYFNGNNFVHYIHNPDNIRSLPNNNVWSILEDSDNQLWIGTLGGGISIFDRETNGFNNFTPFPNNSNYNITNNPNFIMSISENIDKNIWFATAYGIDLFDKRMGRFMQFLRDEKSSNTLSSNTTLDVYCDSRGWIWIATRNGLNFYDPKSQKMTILGENNGILENNILTVLEANDGNMWVATPKGLTNIIITQNDRKEYKFSTKNYDEKDGLHGKEFNEHAALKTSNGELIFGGSDGFSIFDPANLANTNFNPKVLFNDLKIENKTIETGQEINERILLPSSLNHLKNITLKHFEKTFSVSFSAINYLNPEKTIFHYKLEGFNEEWTSTAYNKREVTYTNLSAGEYVFRLYAGNLDNSVHSDEIQLSINILPPFWKTKWAYLAYLVFIIIAILLTIKLIIRRERKKYLIKKERLETLKIHEMDMLKLKFFTNISHEFRTPLTLILTPLERIIKSTEKGNNKDQLKLIQRNAKRLLNLVNQLLDFRRLEVQGLTLEVREAELVSYCREATESFSDLSETRNIKLTFNTNLTELKASFDYDKIEKIIFNLLSNAFKFTPENGEVSVNLFVNENSNGTKAVVLEVKDTGIGIPKEKHELIFERFVQSLPEGVTVNKGSGIGLSLTREFVQMHEGTIQVESMPGVGSCFRVNLPLKNKFNLQQSENFINRYKIKHNDLAEEEIDEQNRNSVSSCKILLVEDNPDIRFYLKDNLKSNYEILEASNGRLGWEIILEHMPDLIVSDIMMPDMDGIELCKTIKTDNRTSHIPVILLTAHTTDQHKYDGFENGADDYITKPFNFELLELRINYHIDQRQKKRKQFQQSYEIKPSEINITSLDDKFLAKVKAITEENMQEPDFSVEKLSSEVGISRAHLYNKLLALTGKTPIEYIRIMRIRRAAQLLVKSQLTVMEIAYKVGFNDPRYFTKHFKNEYNMTPTQYIKQVSSILNKTET